MTAPHPNLRGTLVFGLVLLWKLGLLVTAALPPPSNDAFFYDGAVVNLIRHGSYSNPSLALALPISGTQVFSAYPPLYQWALLPWMRIFGTSELSAMYFHFLLFAMYAGIAFAILNRLSRWIESGDFCPPAGRADPEADRNVRAPGGGAFHIAGLFLLAVTFHDRPDSLAHVFGLGAVYGLIRFLECPHTAPRQSGCEWSWIMIACALLALCTGLQIGALYIAVIWLGVLLAHFTGRARFPLWPMSALVVTPLLLVAWVKTQHPLLWQGFTEHARLTPALTGFRIPRFDELLKIGRAAPGIFAVAALGLWFTWRAWRGSTGSSAKPERGNCRRLQANAGPRGEAFELPRQKDRTSDFGLRTADFTSLFLVSTALPVLGVLGAAAFFVTPNAGSFTMYLQPIIVGAFLFLVGSRCPPPWRGRVALLFVALALFASIRAIGLSTWGLVSAADCGRTEALQRVQHAISDLSPQDSVVLSSAYLYEASRESSPRAIHCDWLQPPGPDQLTSDLEGLVRLKPRRIVLTQFDYFRRYEPLLDALKEHRPAVSCTITNTARVATPDSLPPLRRVLQHISWAPVIITLDW